VIFDRRRADPYDRARGDEDGRLDRRFRTHAAAAVRLTGSATPVPGRSLDELVGNAAPEKAARGRDVGLTVSGSSTWRKLPTFAPRSALDGSTSTSWIPDSGDRSPTLTLRWRVLRRVDRLTLSTGAGPFQPITRVVLSSPAGMRRLHLGSAGTARFQPLRTDRITLSFADPPRVPNADGRTIAVAELRVPALDGATIPSLGRGQRVRLGCGSGPPLTIDGRSVATRVDTTVGALAAVRAVPFEACSTVRLAEGWHHLDAGPGHGFEVATANLLPLPGIPDPAPKRSLRIERWDAERRSVHIGRGEAALVALTENATSGRQATLNGHRLTALRVDG